MAINKNVLKSSTIWGLIIAYASQLGDFVQVLEPEVAIITGAVGAIVSVLGRLKAKLPLKFW